MIRTGEKAIVHIYKQAAGLSEFEYRALLYRTTGRRSCADPKMSHKDVDHLMAALETVLWQRVDSDRIDAPQGGRIRDRYYWRSRLGRPGQMTTRQWHRISELWTQLMDAEGAETWTHDYVVAVIDNALPPGLRVSRVGELTAAGAAMLIDALEDRLGWAIARQRRSA